MKARLAILIICLGVVVAASAATVTNLWIGTLSSTPAPYPDNALTIGGDFLLVSGDYLALE